jgi:membrane protease YdiL (CAAX protease family)
VQNRYVRAALAALLPLVVFLLFSLTMGGAVFFLPPPWGLLLTLLVFAGVLHHYLLPLEEHGRPGALALRPIPASARRWVIVSVPVMLGLLWGASEVYMSLVPVPAEALNPFAPLLRDPLGRLTVVVLAIGVAPVIEEFFFRGLIQGSLERAFGGVVAIGVTSALFAAVHMLVWVFPLHFLLGVIFGWVVYTTRSIWAGVLLHAANNVAAVLGMGAGEDPLTRPTVWDVGLDAAWWTALAVLVIFAVAAYRVAKRIRAATAGLGASPSGA